MEENQFSPHERERKQTTAKMYSFSKGFLILSGIIIALLLIIVGVISYNAGFNAGEEEAFRDIDLRSLCPTATPTAAPVQTFTPMASPTAQVTTPTPTQPI